MSERPLPDAQPDPLAAIREEPTTMPEASETLDRTPAEQAAGQQSQAYQEEWADENSALPRRPRRRLVTPLNAALAGVLLVACGFVGGVLVEKGQTGGTAAAGGAGRRAFAAGFGPGAGAAAGRGGGAAAPTDGSGATAGTVSTVSGHDLYVTDTQGNTVHVHAGTGAKVIRATTTAVSAIHPGDAVIAQGARSSNGTLTAISIRATAPAAGGGGGALAALFGGGGFGGRGGGAAGSGGPAATPGAGGAGGATRSGGGGQAPLFGPG